MKIVMEQFPAKNPNPVLSAGMDGTVLYSNLAGEPLLHEWGVNIGEKLPSYIIDFVQRVISQNTPEKIEVKAANWTYITAFHPLPEEECVNIYGFDISDQKEVEGKLRESENKYRNIVETSVEGIWIFNAVSETTYVNEKMAEMLGYNREEMAGSFIWDYADEEDKGFFLAKLANRKQGIDEVYEIKLIHKDGSPLCVSVSAKAFFDGAGKFAGSVGMFTDITEHKKAEEALRLSNIYNRSLIEASLDPLVTIGYDGKVKDVNKATEQATGYSRNDLIGTYFAQYLTKPDQAIRAFQRVCECGELRDCPLNIQHKDGHATPVLCNASVYRDEHGEIIGVFVAARDITERKKAEEAIKLSNIYNRSLIEASLDPLVTIGYDGKITDVNIATEQVTGYSRNHLIGTDFSDYFTEPEKALTSYQKVFTDGKVWDYPLEIRHKDGHTTPVLYNASVYITENGEVIGVFAAARDITTSKKAEEALKKAHDNLEELVKERTIQLEIAHSSLKESEGRLAEAQRLAHIGNWDRNLVTDDLYWSDEMYHIFGLNPQESSATYNLLLSHIHPEDRDYVDNAVKGAVKGKPFVIDLRIISGDDEERIVHAQGIATFDDKNTPVRIRGTVQDITERKKSEEKIQNLANIVESSNDAIGTISLEGIIITWNNEAEKIYGYSVEEILGKPISTLAPPHLDKETTKLIKLIKQGIKIQRYETTRLRKDGKTIYVSFTLSPVFDIYGKMNAVSFISRDITERKEAEKALENIDNARQKEIHHRIKNNLQVISSLLELMADKFKNRDNIKDLEVLEAFKESQNRVLSMALIHEELHKGEGFATLNISSYIEVLADNLLLTYRLGNNAINLSMNLDQNVLFDMDTAIPLGIIINELVSNSLKHGFSDINDGEILIELHREEGKNNTFTLTVSDNGVGIPENLDIGNLESLGLQLVTTLVDQLNGELELKRDNGTEFTIRFTVTKKSNQASVPAPQLVDNE
jgi:PAS domain S-box-containing protein